MDHHIDYVRRLVRKGGPQREDYYDLDAWIVEVVDQARRGSLTPEQVRLIQREFGDAFSVTTMQGFAFNKPRGYAGDYEIIDRTYCTYAANEPHLARWDRHWQEHAAAKAVRNRVSYLGDLLLATRRPGRDSASTC